jgi:protein tyrosine/serine phosphatase
MKQRFLSHRALGVVAITAIICAITLTAGADPDHKRSAGAGTGVDIENFGKVNDHFYRGAQPEGHNYEQLAAFGIKTIVDLRDDAKEDARSATERAGMRYINLPMKEKSYPQADTAARFLTIINDESNWPVFVHCAGGKHRTGVMTAVYRMSVDGWGVEQAYQEMKQYHFYTSWGHGCYKDYVYDYYRGLLAQSQRPNMAPVTHGRSDN